MFLFAGPMATLVTVYAAGSHVGPASAVVSVALGLFAAAMLMANNMRDLGDDAAAGKRTLPALLGARPTGVVFSLFLALPYALLGVVAMLLRDPWVLVPLLSLPVAVLARVAVPGPRNVALTELLFGGLLAGVFLAA